MTLGRSAPLGGVLRALAVLAWRLGSLNVIVRLVALLAWTLVTRSRRVPPGAVPSCASA